MPLIEQIDAYLARTGIAPARFGRSVAHDPRLVFDIRKGRKLRPTLQSKIVAQLQHNRNPTNG